VLVKCDRPESALVTVRLGGFFSGSAIFGSAASTRTL